MNRRRRFHPYKPRTHGATAFVEIVERLYPGSTWRPEWASAVSFEWTVGALEAVGVWKRTSGLNRVDSILRDVYLSGDDLFRDAVIDTLSKKVDRRPNTGGGDCFFLAVSYALFGDEKAAPHLRKLAAIYRIRRLEIQDKAAQRTAFAEYMRPTTWAEDHSIQGLVCALKGDFTFVDPTQPQHAFSAIYFDSVCESTQESVVRVSLWSHSATTTEKNGHFESFDVIKSISF